MALIKGSGGNGQVACEPERQCRTSAACHVFVSVRESLLEIILT